MIYPILLLALAAPLALDPVEAVLAGFDEHPIVAISESHWNEEVHQVLRAIIQDPRFLARADDIVVEFAGALHQDRLDRYISGEEVSIEELSAVWQDVVVSPQTTWDAPVYARFFETVRNVNLEAGAAGSPHRLRVLAGDPPIDWSKVNSRAELLAIHEDPDLDRDAWFASVVQTEVLAKGRRALLISGGGHLTRHNLWEAPAANPSPDTTTVRLLRARRDSVYVVYTLGSRILDDDELLGRLADLQAPTVIPLGEHWLGTWDAGDFIGVRRYNVEGPGKWACAGRTFSEVADAALYLGTTFTDSLPPLDYQSDAYRTELNRRRRILGAPELSRVDQGVEQVRWFAQAGRIEDAIDGIEQIRSWPPDSRELGARLDELMTEIQRDG
jgi:hypothetical protein